MIDSMDITLREGGLTLGALLILAIAIYATLYDVWKHLGRARILMMQKQWLGQTVVKSLPWETTAPKSKEVQRLFACFELDEIAWIQRRLPFLAILVTSAPLLGLLGTVAGMLVTFDGMATVNHGSSVNDISSGISKALVTTQAGLVIAIPAAFLLALVKRQMETFRLELHAQLCECLAKVS